MNDYLIEYLGREDAQAAVLCTLRCREPDAVEAWRAGKKGLIDAFRNHRAVAFRIIDPNTGRRVGNSW